MLRLEGDRTVKGVAFSPCSRYVAVAGWEAVRVWNLATGETQTITGPVGAYIQSVAFSPDGRQLAWLEGANPQGQWQLVARSFLNGKAREPTTVLLTKVKAFGFLPSGLWIAIQDQHIHVGGLARQAAPVFDRFADSPLAVCHGQDGFVVGRRGGQTTAAVYDRYFVKMTDLTGPDWTLDLWRADANNRFISSASGQPSKPILGYAISPDGEVVAAVGVRGLVVWNVRTQTILTESPTKYLTAVAFTPDGRHLLVGGHDNAVQLWDAATWQPPKMYDWRAGWIDALAVAPDGLTAAVACWNGEVVIWDLEA